MAYGMLTSFGLGALQGLGNAVVNKLSRDQEAELKDKAEAEREARIEEAKIRAEQRAQAYAVDPNNPEYLLQQQRGKLLEEQIKSAQSANSPEAQAAERAKRNAEIIEANFKASDEHQQNVIDEERARLEATRQQTAASKASENNATLTREKTQLEIADIKKKQAAGDNLLNAVKSGDSAAIEQAQREWNAVNGKKPNVNQIRMVQVDSGKKDMDGKIILEPKLFSVDPETNEAEEVKTKSSNANLSRPQREQAAVDAANAQFGTLYKSASDVNKIATDSSWFNQKTPEEKKAATDWLKTYGTALASQSYDKPSGGMLNGKTEDINKLYDEKVNIGGMRKPNSQEFEPSQGVAKDLHKMDHQLWLYGTGESKNVDKPLNTIRETISTWSPKSDKNDTDRLIAEASKLLNIDPDAKIDLTDSATRGQIMKAIVKQEHGGQIKGDINKIYQYIDATYGSTPLQNKTSNKIISIEKVG